MSMRLSSITPVTRGAGDKIAVGRCGQCHRPLGLSTANKQGVRCRDCKIQYNAAGASVTLFRTPEAGTVEPWPEKAERLLAAAQAVCSESYEDGNEDGNLGLSERVDCVPKEVMDDLKAIVTEISDDVVTLIRKVQADAADES